MGKKTNKEVRTNSKLRVVLTGLLIIACSLVVYRHLGAYDFINLDDDIYVNNRFVKEGITTNNIKWAFGISDNPLTFYWHPVTWLSHMLDCQLFGLNPGMHHLMNLFLHVLNTLLLFIALYRMTGGIWKSAFVAALFAVHPINVESVAWIAERKNVLSTLFWMLTMLSYLHYARRPGIRRYLLMIVPFILGLMTKPMLITLPCVLLLLDFWPMGRMGLFQTNQNRFKKSTLPRLVLEKLPLLALSVIGAGISIMSVLTNRNIVSNETIPMPLRLENGLISYIKYIEKLFRPHDLAVFYPFPASIPGWQIIAAGMILAGISITALLLIKKAPYLLIGWLWYLGTLFPVIGVFQQGRWPAMADRFAYVPEIGLFIMISWGGSALFAGFLKRKKILAVFAVSIIALLMVTARIQTSYWKNSITLFTHALEVTGDSFPAHYNLAQALAAEGKSDEALAHYYQASEVEETAGTHLNIGSLLAAKGKIDEAVKHYYKALAINETDEAHTYLGDALVQKGRINNAIKQYNLALKLNPDYLEALNSMGNLLLNMGRTDEAIAYFSRALRVAPDSKRVHNNLGNALMKKGMFKQALVIFNDILKADPDHVEANINMGVALSRLNRIDAAISHYKAALAAAPDNAEAHNNLGVLLARKKRYPEAKAQFEAALRLRPGYANAESNLKRLQGLLEKPGKPLVHENTLKK